MTDKLPWIGWHFLPRDGLTRFDRVKVEVGCTYRTSGPIKVIDSGFHASRRAFDALHFTNHPIGIGIVCRVILSGEIDEADDGYQAAASERTVLWMANAEPAFHLFAVWCAEQCLQGRYPAFAYALDVKRRWVQGQVRDYYLRSALGQIQPFLTGFVGQAVEIAMSSSWQKSADIACYTAGFMRGAFAANEGDRYRQVWAEQNAELERLLEECRQGGQSVEK